MQDSFAQWVLDLGPITPWRGEDKIPWDEPEFSERMLQAHLDQSTGLASRPFSKIDAHVDFIHQVILQGRTSRILDLGCGPGFYVHRLCQLGHHAEGIDFSPASLAYAQANGPGEFLLGNLVDCPFGEGYDLVSFLFGEPNTLHPDGLARLVKKSALALRQGGRLLLEVTKPEVVEAMGREQPRWHRSQGGLLSPCPHLVLQESAWDAQLQAAKTRWLVLPEDGPPVSYESTTQAWAKNSLIKLLESNGFREIQLHPSLTGEPDPECPETEVVAAAKFEP